MKVILSTKGNNSKIVAGLISKKLNLKILFLEDNPNINLYEEIFFVISNRGDEELPEIFENFLIKLNCYNKKYNICELGNYFGFEYDYFGSRKLLESFLKSLKWKEGSSVSIDSLPEIDEKKLESWLNEIYKRNFSNQ